jgi:hypothetical protein
MVVSGVADAKPDKAPKSNKGKGTINKVAVCHVKGKKRGTDTVRYQLISIAQSAVPAHLAHGDVYADSLVGETYYGADCSVSATVEVDAGAVSVQPSGCAFVACASTDTAVGGGYEPMSEPPDPLISSGVAAIDDIPEGCVSYGGDGVTGFFLINNTAAQPGLTSLYAICATPAE